MSPEQRDTHRRYKGRDPGLLLEANADFTVLHEFARHAGVVVGLRGGAVVVVRGHDGSGKRRMALPSSRCQS